MILDIIVVLLLLFIIILFIYLIFFKDKQIQYKNYNNYQKSNDNCDLTTGICKLPKNNVPKNNISKKNIYKKPKKVEFEEDIKSLDNTFSEIDSRL
jgi:hypothetical protein